MGFSTVLLWFSKDCVCKHWRRVVKHHPCFPGGALESWTPGQTQGWSTTGFGEGPWVPPRGCAQGELCVSQGWRRGWLGWFFDLSSSWGIQGVNTVNYWHLQSKMLLLPHWCRTPCASCLPAFPLFLPQMLTGAVTNSHVPVQCLKWGGMSSGGNVLSRKRHPESGLLLQVLSIHSFSPKEAETRKATDTHNNSNVLTKKKMMSEATAGGEDVWLSFTSSNTLSR